MGRVPFAGIRPLWVLLNDTNYHFPHEIGQIIRIT